MKYIRILIIQYLRVIWILQLLIIFNGSIYAVDWVEIDGLRYEYQRYNGPVTGNGEVYLVGYGSNVPNDLKIPFTVKYQKQNIKRTCYVSTIASGAFSNCLKLKSVNISSVEYIKSNAFANCTSLQKVSLGSCRSINSKAFSGCTNLETIYFGSYIPSIAKDAFDDNTYQNAKLIVPDTQIDDVKKHEVWGKFQYIITMYSMTIHVTGGGSVSCNDIIINNNENKGFSVQEGSSITLSFSSSEGRELATLYVGGKDVTSKVINNKYTIDNVSESLVIQVSFFSITITAKGNGHILCKTQYKYSPLDLQNEYGDTRNGTNCYIVPEDYNLLFYVYPDEGSQLIKITQNGTDITSQVINGLISSSNISYSSTLEFIFEDAIPVTHALSIKSTGKGSVSFNGTNIREEEKTYTIEIGKSYSVSFLPDQGFRIKSVEFNNTDVTSKLTNNQYTISNVNSDNNLEVEFEAIPITTYALSITASGNGSASYNGTTAKNNTKSFTLNEGSSATITFSPDNGYRIKSVKVNNSNVTSSVSNNQYTISNIKANTTVEVVFEAISVTTYTLSITASGNGSASYSGTTAKNSTKSFTLNEGSSATITFSPDNGYRIKSVKVNNSDVTSSVSNSQYTVSSIKANTTVEVVFEAIPITTYTLSITASGNGSASYSGTTAKNSTKSFSLNEGTSATITFSPDNGYRIKSVKVNSTDVTSKIFGNSYTVSNINANTTVEVVFEAVPVTTYTLSITASGNGSASYSGTTAKNSTKSFTLNEGSSATIMFTPDNGYRIKSVKVNSTDVTSSISNNQYTVSSISANTTIEVEFEAIPVTTYTLSITASGNGSASYSGTTAKNNTKSFTLNEGSSATITFSPDNGYRIKSVKANNTDVTSQVSNNSYTVSNIKANTTVEVVFEAIPVTTYTLSITASGNGSVSYSGTTAKNNTKSFTLNEGTSATITFSPDNGYRIKSVKVNNSDVTSQVSNNSYTVSNIKANTTIEVVFEAIPVTTYTLSITASGNGSASYSGTTAKNNTKSFTLNEGSSATITFSPDNGYRIKSVKVNSKDVTSQVSNNSYTISSIKANTTVEVEFEAIPITTYTLTITASGNGSATYSGTTAKNNSKSFTLNEGTSATIMFTPDNGYRIKSVKVNNSDVTSSVSNSRYTVSSIKANTTVKVEFEAISITTYTLSITASGNGSASYSGTTAKNNTKSFTLNEGTSATITFSPDNGYRIKSVKVNSTDVTSSVSNNQYTVSNISANTTVEVEFESIPVNSYTLKYVVDGETYKTYQIKEGATITPEAEPTKEGYTFSGWTGIPQTMPGRDVTVTGTFTKNEPITVENFTVDGINYHVTASGKVEVISANDGIRSLYIPSTVSYDGASYQVTSIAKGAFERNTSITSVEIANGIETIGKNAFGGCSNMTWIVIPNSITTVGDAAFYGCEGLESIHISTNLTSIGSNTFWGCTGIASITIPSNIRSIGEEAFKDCLCMKEVVSEIENPFEIDNSVFNGIPSTAVLTVPNGTKASYMQYNGWTMHFSKVKEVGEPDNYQLTIKATGSGNVSYNDRVIKNDTQSIDIAVGMSAVVKFNPDDGYQIKHATMNGREIADLSSMSFTIDIMDEDVTIEVEFEAIPIQSYTLKYVVDGESYKTYQVEEGATITPEAEPTKEGYTFSGWSEIPGSMPSNDVTVTGTFTKNGPDISLLGKIFAIDGVHYEVASTDEQSVVVAEGDYGQVLEVPATVTFGDYSWEVKGLKDGVLENNENLAAVIWNPSATFNARVSNPNLLLYVKDDAYKSLGVKNVVVNGIADNIELTDAASGNDFCCPRAFTAKKISYSHYYNMETGLGDSKGWETIVLPFDVQTYTSPKGEIVPFGEWKGSGSTKPFWLFELTASGYHEVDGIKANTPYIISMPNNPQYLADYVITGIVTFSAENVQVKASDDIQTGRYQDRTFVPNYTNRNDQDCFALNVKNYYVTNSSTDKDGSKFIKGLRTVHPFEAYMTTTGNTRSIDVMDGITTAIRDLVMKAEGTDVTKVYDTKGVLVKTAKTGDDLRRGLAAGVYIVNGKKMIIK